MNQAIKFGIPIGDTAKLLKTRTKSLQTLIISRTASTTPLIISGQKRSKKTGQKVLLKPAFKALAGTELTDEQKEVNDYFAGLNLVYLTKQIRLAVEAQMLPDREAEALLWFELALLEDRLNRLALPSLADPIEPA